MKVVYVAGPYRGANAWEIECNIHNAEILALEVWAMGAAALCPHANTRYFQNVLPDEVWLDGDLAMLAKCDALITTDEWTRSVGAATEVGFAHKLGIPVFHERYLLKEWLDFQRALAEAK